MALALILSAAVLFATCPLGAQTDYFNTDRGRPVRIEDAYPAEWHALELKLAPLRLDRAPGGAYTWGVEPEVAFGVLPRTQVELGAPVSYADRGAGLARRAGLTGLDLSVMHNFNTETLTLPALALRADVLAPVGGLAPDRTSGSFTALLTRTFRPARLHANAEFAVGPRPAVAGSSGADQPEASRWLAGIAADRAFPLRAVLVTLEGYARQPVAAGADVEWNVGAGVRAQWSPRVTVDAGAGRRLTGPAQSWFVTFGTAYAFSIRALVPVPAR